MLYISARLRIAAHDEVRAPPTLVCNYNYLASADDPTRAYRLSKTPDKYVFSVIHTARRY